MILANLNADSAATLEKIYREYRSTPIKDAQIEYISGLGHKVTMAPRDDALHGKKRIGYNDLLKVYYEKQATMDFKPAANSYWDKEFVSILDDLPMHKSISDPAAPYYAEYEPVRQNIAMLRTVLLSTPPLSDMSDENVRPTMNQAASMAASSMKWHSFWRTLGNSLTFKKPQGDITAHRFGNYGKEHLGVARMYEKIQKKQGKFIINPILWLRGQFIHPRLGLPPIEETALSLDKDMLLAMYIEEKEDKLGMENISRVCVAESMELFESSKQLYHVEHLPYDQRERAHIEARNILDNLKNLNFGRPNREMDSREQQRQELEAGQNFLQLAEEYQKVMSGIVHEHPHLLQEPIFAEAKLAIGKLGNVMMVEAMNELVLDDKNPKAVEELAELTQAHSFLPDEFTSVIDNDPEKLVKKIQEALEYAAEYQGMVAARRQRQDQIIQPGSSMDPAWKQGALESTAPVRNKIAGRTAKISGVGGMGKELINDIIDLNHQSAAAAQTGREQTQQPERQQTQLQH
jgi:hypothetical protein